MDCREISSGQKLLAAASLGLQLLTQFTQFFCVGYSPLPLLFAGFRGCPAYCRVLARPHILAPCVLVPFWYLRPLTVRSWLRVHVQSHLHLHRRQHIRVCCRPRRCPSRDPMLFLEEILVTIHVVLVSPLSLAYFLQVLRLHPFDNQDAEPPPFAAFAVAINFFTAASVAYGPLLGLMTETITCEAVGVVVAAPLNRCRG